MTTSEQIFIENTEAHSRPADAPIAIESRLRCAAGRISVIARAQARGRIDASAMTALREEIEAIAIQAAEAKAERDEADLDRVEESLRLQAELDDARSQHVDDAKLVRELEMRIEEVEYSFEDAKATIKNLKKRIAVQELVIGDFQQELVIVDFQKDPATAAVAAKLVEAMTREQFRQRS